MSTRLAQGIALLVFASLGATGYASDRGLEKAPPKPASGRSSATSFDSWEFWYHNNADRLEALAAPGRVAPLDGALATRRTALLSTLRDLLGASVHQFVAANACRALGRATQDPADATRLAAILADPKEQPTVREGAALGLGLLRRSDGAQRLPVAVYDEARAVLLQAAADASAQMRLRGLAMLALGLLADQPHGKDGPAGEAVAARLCAFVRESAGEHRLATAALHALALQPADHLAARDREMLRLVVTKGAISGERAADLTRGFAALALGAVGQGDDLATLLQVTHHRRQPHHLRRSAAIALGRYSSRLSLEEREQLARSVLRLIDKPKDNSTRNFLLMSLVTLLTTGPEEETATLLARTQIDEKMLKTADRGRYLERPFGALALGLVLREIHTDSPHPALSSFRTKALVTLRKGLCDLRQGATARSAFVLALGLARDGPAVGVLRAMAADDRRHGTVRGYALLALAFAAPGGETHRFTRDQLQRTPGGMHAMMATRVLGLTGDHANASTVELLARGVRTWDRRIPCGEAAVALARIGTVEAADVLLAVAPDPKRQDMMRGMAAAGLGRIGSPESVSSLCRLAEGLNYRAQTDLVSELLSYF